MDKAEGSIFCYFNWTFFIDGPLIDTYVSVTLANFAHVELLNRK